ncbi:GH3 auxin-responsive promoter family protein [Niabella sp. W65]|nr:GH3 auxin-responsive promoter family protein [Niabella sp. W65]MCH7369474.1 GH3 auxin-responsive promoter family protein [Niabella sp. W65]ULT45008.1 GH3 auxin-responsive promoter family protein [Niabella sp. I65]
MALLSPAISSLARMRQWRIDAWRSHPIDSQREVIQNLVTSAQYTEFGRKHNFHNIYNIRDFKKAVPICEYDDLKPYIERMMRGEQNLLWNSPIFWFAKSSGTTSDKSKFIPISEESLEDCHFKAAKDVLTMYYSYNPDSAILTGKGLVLGGSHTINPVNNEAQYGDLSAVLLQNSPFWGTGFVHPTWRLP